MILKGLLAAAGNPFLFHRKLYARYLLLANERMMIRRFTKQNPASGIFSVNLFTIHKQGLYFYK